MIDRGHCKYRIWFLSIPSSALYFSLFVFVIGLENKAYGLNLESIYLYELFIYEKFANLFIHTTFVL